ncbi:hypothetical protein [Clostridium baratii]|uniref:hypothetical protein n=1 Tax=Clostridium baratii TaxID=1561 RepID=UPI0030D58B2E
MIKNVKLEIERDDFKNIEIKLYSWQIIAVKELLGLEILLDTDDRNKYTIKKSDKDIVINRLEKIRK